LTDVLCKEMKAIPGGEFSQSDIQGNGFIHSITDLGFMIGVYEITYELWYVVRQWAIVNGYQFANAGREGNDGMIGAVPTSAKYEPVTEINWRDAIVWCNAYSQMNGMKPAYFSDEGCTIPIKDSRDGSYAESVNTMAGSFDCPYVDWNGPGYRLPSEGEWQYAARRIGVSTWLPVNYASGASASVQQAAATSLVAWYNGNSGGTTRTVGAKNPNAMGLYDMSGNVTEWCHDWSWTWPVTSQADYRGPASWSQGCGRVVMGGSANDEAPLLQAGYRLNYGIFPYYESRFTGFRIAKKVIGYSF